MNFDRFRQAVSQSACNRIVSDRLDTMNSWRLKPWVIFLPCAETLQHRKCQSSSSCGRKDKDIFVSQGICYFICYCLHSSHTDGAMTVRTDLNRGMMMERCVSYTTHYLFSNLYIFSKFPYHNGVAAVNLHLL